VHHLLSQQKTTRFETVEDLDAAIIICLENLSFELSSYQLRMPLSKGDGFPLSWVIEASHDGDE
jgi:hypothetical protein